jgi:hypothetical protein
MKLSEYFSENRYKPKYQIGDRVFGKYNNIPFIGTVGNDTLVNESIGPYITIHLDLPIIIDKVSKLNIIVKHKDVKRLSKFDEPVT